MSAFANMYQWISSPESLPPCNYPSAFPSGQSEISFPRSSRNVEKNREETGREQRRTMENNGNLILQRCSRAVRLEATSSNLVTHTVPVVPLAAVLEGARRMCHCVGGRCWNIWVDYWVSGQVCLRGTGARGSLVQVVVPLQLIDIKGGHASCSCSWRL